MRVVRRRPAAILAATVLAVGALSACGGEGEGGSPSSSTTATTQPVDPSSSSSNSSSSSTSSSSSSGSSEAPGLPEAATKHTQDGAVAFAKYYWSEGGEALKTGDTSLLKEIVSKDCDVCHTYIDSIDEDANKGLHSNVNPSKIGSAKVTDKTEGNSDQVVTLEVTDTKYLLVDEEGKAVGQADRVEYDILIYVDWEDSRWTVVDSYMITK